jgi:hypothetical protein
MEDLGKFAPDAVLKGQNYLDPRSQIGYPETIGGVLRNANRGFRSEPINPRTPGVHFQPQHHSSLALCVTAAV